MTNTPEYEVVWNGGPLLPPRPTKSDDERLTTGLLLERGDIRLIMQQVSLQKENRQRAGQWERSYPRPSTLRLLIGAEIYADRLKKRTKKASSQAK